MPKYRGKPVYYLRKGHGTSSGRVSPIVNTRRHQSTKPGVQVRFIHDLSDLFRHYLSPPILRSLPLTEHYLYPVSTAPINSPTKRNLKERY